MLYNYFGRDNDYTDTEYDLNQSGGEYGFALYGISDEIADLLIQKSQHDYDYHTGRREWKYTQSRIAQSLASI